jgi:hypothetical protein
MLIAHSFAAWRGDDRTNPKEVYAPTARATSGDQGMATTDDD